MVPLVQTESGMSGIPLQNHFVQTNIQNDAFSTDDMPLNLSVKNLVKKEPEDFEINPDQEKYKQICQRWKHFEMSFKQHYPVIDRNYLWPEFWNKVLLISQSTRYKLTFSLIERNKKYTLRTANLGPLQKN